MLQSTFVHNTIAFLYRTTRLAAQGLTRVSVLALSSREVEVENFKFSSGITNTTVLISD